MNIITIREIENRKSHYLAFYRDSFLKCVFSVSFQDSITGSLALIRFFKMIKAVYKGRDFDFTLSDRKIRFKSQAVIDALITEKK